VQIFKSKVIRQNLDLVTGFVRDIRPGDSDDILLNRVGGSITVSPEGTGGQAERVEVTFKTNLVLVVSKHADARELTALLNQAVSQVGALGTGSFGPGSLQPVGSLLDASVATLERICRSESAQGTIPIHVPIDLPPLSPLNPPRTVKVTGTVSGWTVTNDTGSNEIANVSFLVRLDGQPNGNLCETKNEGAKAQIKIDPAASVVQKPVAPPVANGYMQVDYQLMTDGFFVFATVSLVEIKEIVLSFAYV
jgi:hypothetical protein